MQIIICMDREKFTDICSIRKAGMDNKESQCEIIYADSKDTLNIPDQYDITGKSLVLLTDLPEVCSMAAEKGICCVGLESSEGELTDAWCCLQPPIDLDLSWLEMQMCHYYDLPYVLFEEDGIRIRESRDTDMARILEILQETSLSVEGFPGRSETEEAACGEFEAEQNIFHAYTTQMYRMWGFGMWTIERDDGSSSPDSIGWCGLFPTELPGGGVELGYVIAPEEQGKGIGYSVCSRILSYADQHLDLDTIYLRVTETNIQSIRLAEKLGFLKSHEEGRDRVYYRSRN